MHTRHKDKITLSIRDTQVPGLENWGGGVKESVRIVGSVSPGNFCSDSLSLTSYPSRSLS